MEQQELLICKCHSPEHQIIFSWDDDFEETQVYMTIHLNKCGFWQRLKYGIKYIFGRQCKYGAFDEVILNPEDARKMYNVYRYLNKPNVGKYDKTKFKRGDTITNGENHGAIVVDKTFDADNSGRELHWTYRCLKR